MESEFQGSSQMPPQSGQKPQTPPKDVQKVISGEAVAMKKSPARRFRETFTIADTKTVITTVISGVLIPQSKNLIYDLCKMALEVKLFGQSTSNGMRSGGMGQQAVFTAYNRMSPQVQQILPTGMMGQQMPQQMQQQFSTPGNLSAQARQMHDWQDIKIPSMAEAEVVLQKLYNILSTYEVTTVADYYNACGITPAFTDEAWGWYSLAGTQINPIRDGWLINLPAAVPLTQ